MNNNQRPSQDSQTSENPNDENSNEENLRDENARDIEQQESITGKQPDPLTDTTTNDTTAKKSRILRSLIIVFLIALVALGLWLAYKPAPQQIQGMVEATTLNVSTKVPSRVEQLIAEEGDQVKKGQVLGILTSPELQAKQQQAEGALQSARALEQTAVRGSQQENIASLRANWQSAQAQAELARVTYHRSQNLFNEGVISRQRRDEAQAAKNSSAQIAEAARQQYLRAERGSTPEQLSSAQAQVKIAEAAVFEAKSLNQEMQLVAPEDGEVSQKFANVGELVPAGIPLYTLIDLRNQWVSINLREDQFNQLKHGSILHGDIPALSQHNVAFRVIHIAAQGTFASWKATRQSSGYDVRTFEVKLKSLQPLAGLRPGMSVLFDWPQHQVQSQIASSH
jgi:HlyD family secretion protein